MTAKVLKKPYRLRKVTFKLSSNQNTKKKLKFTISVALVTAFDNKHGNRHCKICHRSISTEYLEDFFFQLGQSRSLGNFYIENYAYCRFCGHSMHCFILSLSVDALYDFNSRNVDGFIFIR